MERIDMRICENCEYYADIVFKQEQVGLCLKETALCGWAQDVSIVNPESVCEDWEEA